MYRPGAQFEHESHPEITVQPPVSEILLDSSRSLALWADGSTHDAVLARQIEQHASQAQCVANFLDVLPATTTSIEDAIANGQVNESVAVEFYASLGALLHDPDTARLVLYFPFELIPHRAWQPPSAKLRETVDLFQQSYFDAWVSQLHVHDVRANFVDGDVLEDEYRDGDVPRVVKAAHLIPELIKRGLLNETDVTTLYTQTDDLVLQQSIAEALTVLHEDNVLPTAMNTESVGLSLETVIANSDLAIKAIRQQLPENVSTRRRIWLEQIARDATMDNVGSYIADAVREGIISDATITSLIKDASRDTHLMLIEGIRQAILMAAEKDIVQARAIFDQYHPVFLNLSEYNDTETNERLTIALRHWYHANVIDGTLLAQWGISPSNLGGPHSGNLPGMAKDISRLEAITTHIAADPELSQYLYPIAVIGGSRLKGYGQQSSDVDVSVFLRANTPASAREKVHELLQTTFTHVGNAYEPIEFWLDGTNDGKLTIRDFPNPDMHTADSYWTHVLFNGAWVGDKEEISDLQRTLLPTYFRADTPARRFYLERLEQDLLQYRLLHKGYARHHAPQVRDTTAHSGAIDGGSTFWDPGYRRLATKLFINNVFLPKL